MRTKLIAMLVLLLLSSCATKTGPSVTESVRKADVVSVARDELLDRAAGNNAAIDYVAQTLPASREKEVIGIFVSDGYRLLGTPKVKTQTDFEAAAANLLSADATKRAKGEEQRLTLATENQTLKTKLASAEAEFKAAQVKEAAEHAAALEKVRLEAEQAQKKLISYIFFGGGALLLAAGVAMLVLASSNPIFGPRVAFGTMLAGGASLGMGVLILELMKQLERHPWIIWVGGGVIALIMAGVCALLYSNHLHHEDSKTV